MCAARVSVWARRCACVCARPCECVCVLLHAKRARQRIDNGRAGVYVCCAELARRTLVPRCRRFTRRLVAYTHTQLYTRALALAHAHTYAHVATASATTLYNPLATAIHVRCFVVPRCSPRQRTMVRMWCFVLRRVSSVFRTLSVRFQNFFIKVATIVVG